MSRGRSRARRLAFQALFMLDARDEWDPAIARGFFARTEPVPPAEAVAYANRLLETYLASSERIDDRIDAAHPRWRIHRMRSEDRNLLRLGIAELWFHEDVPPRVVINEWVELAKTYSGEESPKFVNAILDRAWKEPHADAREPDGGAGAAR